MSWEEGVGLAAGRVFGIAVYMGTVSGNQFILQSRFFLLLVTLIVDKQTEREKV